MTTIWAREKENKNNTNNKRREKKIQVERKEINKKEKENRWFKKICLKKIKREMIWKRKKRKGVRKREVIHWWKLWC